jgi:hypothetical protein
LSSAKRTKSRLISSFRRENGVWLMPDKWRVMAKTIRLGVLTICASFVIAAPAYGALIRWTPEKVEAKLKADSPIAGGGEVGNAVLSADCQGLGKVSRAFVRFECNVRYGGSNGSYRVNVRLRVQQIGSGKLCISALQLDPGRVPAQPWRVPPDAIITRLFRPEKVCTV